MHDQETMLTTLRMIRTPSIYLQHTTQPVSSIEQLNISPSLTMADTGPSRRLQTITASEGDLKVSITFEVTPPSDHQHQCHKIHQHQCCDRGTACKLCNGSYHTEWLQHYPEFSYSRRLTDAEAEEICSKLVSQMQGDRRQISGILERHADIVMSRWMKNGIFGSQQKREDLLSKVAADLPKTPEDVMVYSYSQKIPSPANRSLQTRRMLLLPWLNVEMLKTNPDALLSLLHCRSAFEPSKWAAFDDEQLRGYWTLGHFECDYSEKTIVLYGEEYGSLVDWDVEEIHRGDTMGFPFAVLILEAQTYLMGVLRRALDFILQGIDNSHPVRTERWQQATTTGTFRRSNDIPWSPYTRAAFCAPPVFDLAYWTSLTQSRREKVEDHLRALQYDPAYMRRCIRSVIDSTHWTNLSTETKGAWFVAKVCDALKSYYLWRFMEEECRYLDEVWRRYGGHPCIPGRPLHPEVEHALFEFGRWVMVQVGTRARTLLENMTMSPAFSRHWKAKPGSSGLRGFTRMTETDSLFAFREDPLDWCLSRLCTQSDTGNLIGYPWHFQFLENFLSTSKVGETRRVNELMVGAIDDLAAIHEMANAVNLRRPLSLTIAKQGMRPSLGRRTMMQKQRPPWEDHVYNRICAETGPNLLKAFQQSKSPQGLKGQAWISQQKELRTSLNAFWASVRELKKDDFSRADVSADEVGELLEVISADLSPEYRKAVTDEEDAVYASVKKPQEVLTRATAIFSGEGDKSQTPKREIVHIKNKKKTRPDTPADVRAEEPLVDLSKLSVEEKAPSEPIVVPKRIFEEFVCKVFPAEKNECKRGIDWQAFVHGMTAIGCSVTNSGGGGSEVLFSHELFGKITFHKPHPESRVDTVKLHAWAQRLESRFGWSRERFVVASVQPSEGTEGSKGRSESKETSESKAS